MPLPGERPSAKIAKLFPQTDPLKNQQKDQTDGAKPAETSAGKEGSAANSVKTAAPAAVAQAAVAQPVPLPEARPAIKPSRHPWRHRTHRRYRNVR
jgi:membrane-bound lytic murein transglycosylase A